MSRIWEKYVAQPSPPAVESQAVAGVLEKGLCTPGGGNQPAQLVLGDIRNLTLRFLRLFYKAEVSCESCLSPPAPLLAI